MKRNATAEWKGDGMTGTGALSTQSGAFKEQPYSFKTRFVSEDGKDGTNPEELIAAAHAGCYSMALSFVLTGAGFPPEKLHTVAEIEFQKQEVGFTVVGIALHVTAKVPVIANEKFQELALQAKTNCPISRLLSSIPISLEATLE